MNIINPKLFISYSWDTKEHKEWTLKIATDLRSHGVDVILDQWDARIGNDLPFFMEQGLTTSHIVLCICSEQYVQKANEGIKGVGYEKRILSTELLNNTNKNYIIPVIRNNSPSPKVPIFLSGIKYIDFDDVNYFNCYCELLERIYNEDIKKKPPLGRNPFIGNDISDRITTKLSLEKIEFQNPNMNGMISFDYKKNSGAFIIGLGEYSFNTRWSECGSDSIYCYKDSIKRIGYNPQYTEFPKLGDFNDFDFSSRAKSLKIGEVILLENNSNRFAAIKILKVFKNSTDINHLLKFEYKIYNILEN